MSNREKIPEHIRTWLTTPSNDSVRLLGPVFQEAAPICSWLIDHGLLYDMTKNPPRGNAVEHQELTKAIPPSRSEKEEDITNKPIFRLVSVPLQVIACPIEGHLVGSAMQEIGEKTDKYIVDELRRVATKQDGGTIQDAVKRLHRMKYYGPFLILCTEGGKTKYFMDIKGVEACLETKHIEKGELILVQCTPDVIRVVFVEYPVVKHASNTVQCSLACEIRKDLYENITVVHFS